MNSPNNETRTVTGMSFEDYLLLGRVNVSSLKHMLVSPLHYKTALATPRGPSAQMVKGSASHCAVFEPDTFADRYACFAGDRRSKDYRAFKHANGGKEILTAAEFEDVTRIADAVRANPLVAPYLKSGSAEVTTLWTDPETGIYCKSRQDWVGDVILDLKTTRDADPWSFSRDVVKYRYDMQGAFYVDGYQCATGRDLPYLIVAVESSPPFDVVVYRVPEQVLDVGRDLYGKALERLAVCRESNRWPGRFESEQTLTLPAWAYDGDEDIGGIELTTGGRAA